MATMTSDFFVERLKAWGVTRIYGYSGDGINGVLGALQRIEGTTDGIEFIQVRHEEMAAFMASAHAKFTGELGVCLATGGPGATHLLTGLYDAKLDHAPVLAIAGQAETTVRGGSYQQELNLDRIFADVADYVQEATAPAQVRHVTDRASCWRRRLVSGSSLRWDHAAIAAPNRPAGLAAAMPSRWLKRWAISCRRS